MAVSIKTHTTVVIRAKASNFYPPGADPKIAEHHGDPWSEVAKAERICGANNDAVLHQMTHFAAFEHWRPHFAIWHFRIFAPGWGPSRERSCRVLSEKTR